MGKRKRQHRPAPVAPPPAAGSLVYLRLGQLKIHPQNMRRFYPAHQVKEMAQSIRDYGGLVHALTVVPDGEPDSFYVVDGNVRLQAGRFIGEACPPLKSEIVSQERAQQMLTMLVANTFRYEVDPISEALHYQALRQGEGMSVNAIAERTGLYSARITSRLRLLDLDEPIQELIGQGRLPVSERVVAAFLSVTNVEARVKLAQRLARPGVRINTIEAACAKAVESLALAAPVGRPRGRPKAGSSSRPAPQEKCPRCEMVIGKDNPKGASGLCAYCEEEGAPMISLARSHSDTPAPAADAPMPPVEIRAAARAMCQGCEVYQTSLGGRAAEPAWALVAHAAGETCSNCLLREVAGACQGCPGVEMLRRLFAASHVAHA